MIPTLYLTRNGLLEPLGQSQVFAYLRGLSQNHSITLITYEKPEDWADSARMALARTECKRFGIRWMPQKFQQRPRVIAPALSIMWMAFLVWTEVRSGRAELIHARSYIPAAAALAIHKLTGKPFIFDMRALWPEELITAGRLKRNSPIHKVIVALERACLSKAAGVVSLTHAAAEYLHKVYATELAGRRIAVIPTCVDLNRFCPAQAPTPGSLVHGCIGTILSGWFRTEWLAAWVATVAKLDPSARFDIVTRDDGARVRVAVDPPNELADRLTIGARRPDEMPDAVRGHSLSMMFFTDGLSKLGSAPTRMAEALGCGLPVVANEGVGDVASIVRYYRVGVIVTGHGHEAMEAAFEELLILLADPDLPERCRRAAEEVFSLERGTERYSQLYAQILASRAVHLALAQ